jgi:DhnA family fructose-bisphosphate aldolase class Ia
MIQDLVSWDGSDVADSQTIKGLAAELAACIGPDLVKQTMLEFR